MNKPSKERIDTYFHFLVEEYGFSEIEATQWDHTIEAFHYEYRKERLTFSIEISTSPKSVIPRCHLWDRGTKRIEKWEFLDIFLLVNEHRGEDATDIYPHCATLTSRWWLESWFYKRRHKKELEQEVDDAIAEQARFVKNHYQDLIEKKLTNRPYPSREPIDMVEEGKALKQHVFQTAGIGLFLLVIPLLIYTIVPQKDYWVWALIIPGFVFWTAIQIWRGGKEDLHYESMLQKETPKE